VETLASIKCIHFLGRRPIIGKVARIVCTAGPLIVTFAINYSLFPLARRCRQAAWAAHLRTGHSTVTQSLMDNKRFSEDKTNVLLLWENIIKYLTVSIICWNSILIGFFIGFELFWVLE
jgi:hypothetical protein